jgi:hypothetical protein
MVKLEAIMPTSTRRQYTDAAVRLGSKSSRLVTQMAEDLGILDNVLYRWG